MHIYSINMLYLYTNSSTICTKTAILILSHYCHKYENIYSHLFHNLYKYYAHLFHKIYTIIDIKYAIFATKLYTILVQFVLEWPF